MTSEEIKNFFDQQIQNWPLAAKNVKNLKQIQKKIFRIGDLSGFVQFNPARAVSTLAKTDKESLKNRECFLCKKNRPIEQKGIEILKDWELLVNPFPILPYHFTIVNKNHIPQELQFETGVELSKQLPGWVVFFNADGAGASAPDHIHFQAVPQNSLPLLVLLEESGEDALINLDLPFKIINDPYLIKENKIPQNVYFWTINGESKAVGIPRKAHRPKSYFLEPPFRRAVSPGAIDMAGVIVTPIEEDYQIISDQDILEIYREVAFDNEK